MRRKLDLAVIADEADVALPAVALAEYLSGVELDTDTVEDAMSPDIYAVGPDERLCEVAQVMTARRLGCAIVTERDRVIGIFTANDALRLLALG